MLRRRFINKNKDDVIIITYEAETQQNFCSEDNGIKNGDELYSANLPVGGDDSIEDSNKYIFIKEDYDPILKIGHWYFKCINSNITISTGFSNINDSSKISTFMVKDMKGEYRTFTTLEISEGVEIITAGFGIAGVLGGKNDYLTTLILPQSLKYIQDCAFLGFTNITNIIGGDNLQYITPILYKYNEYYYGNVFGTGFIEYLMTTTEQYSVGKVLLRAKLEQNVNVPENFNQYYGTLFVGGEEIIESVNLPINIDTIQVGQFLNFKKLHTINLSNIITIEQTAFKNCSSLEQVYLPNVNIIRKSAFYNSNVKEVILGDSCTTIEGGSFGHCANLEVFRIPKNLEINISTSSGWGIFDSTTKNIKKVICANDSITSKSASYKLFFYSKNSIEEIIFEDNVKTVHPGITNGLRNLKKVTLSKNTEIIRQLAFNEDTSLTEIILPINLKSIEAAAFKNCTALNNIIYEGTIDEWNNVAKGTDWNLSIPATVVHCINGDVEL
jgi:hypothetical protein